MSDCEVDFTYRFESENGHSVPTVLDHIFTLKRSKSIIIDAGVLHLSDHEFNYIKLEIENESVKEIECLMVL